MTEHPELLVSTIEETINLQFNLIDKHFQIRVLTSLLADISLSLTSNERSNLIYALYCRNPEAKPPRELTQQPQSVLAWRNAFIEKYKIEELGPSQVGLTPTERALRKDFLIEGQQLSVALKESNPELYKASQAVTNNGDGSYYFFNYGCISRINWNRPHLLILEFIATSARIARKTIGMVFKSRAVLAKLFLTFVQCNPNPLKLANANGA
jgi:hypothetical protein